jgi:hypothetical protein
MPKPDVPEPKEGGVATTPPAKAPGKNPKPSDDPLTGPKGRPKASRFIRLGGIRLKY